MWVLHECCPPIQGSSCCINYSFAIDFRFCSSYDTCSKVDLIREPVWSYACPQRKFDFNLRLVGGDIATIPRLGSTVEVCSPVPPVVSLAKVVGECLSKRCM